MKVRRRSAELSPPPLHGVSGPGLAEGWFCRGSKQNTAKIVKKEQLEMNAQQLGGRFVRSFALHTGTSSN